MSVDQLREGGGYHAGEVPGTSQRSGIARFGSPGGGWRASVLAALVYIVTAVAITWPLALHIGRGIYLSPSRPYGDYTGTIANIYALTSGFHIPFLPGHISNFNAPDGLPIDWGLNLVTLPQSMTQFVLGVAFGAVSAFDLYTLLGFVASGLAMFGLVRTVVRRWDVGLVAGWAFAFYPYAVANGEHPDYIHGWPLVLMAWAALRAIERPSLRAGLLAGGAAVLGLAWTPYYLLFGGMEYAAIIAAAVLIGWRRRILGTVVRSFAAASALVGVYLAGVLVLSAADPSAGHHAVNTITDVYQQSARPEEFALAPVWAPLFGPVTGGTILAHGWEFTEKTLYLGVFVLLLALVGVLKAVRRRLQREQTAAVLVGGAIALVAALCSLAPTWRVLGVTIDMPSYFLFRFTSGFRIYERFVIVIELGLCMVAGVGLASILPSGRPRAARVLAVAVGAVVALDLWAPIPNHFEILRVPRVIRTLAEQAPGAYADYPIGPPNERPDYHDLFDEAYANRPIFNGFAAGSAAAGLAQTLYNPAAPWVGGELATLGVRYIILEHHPLPPFEPVTAPRAGFEVISSTSYATLYRNVSRPRPVIEALDGFSYDEGSPPATSRWIIAPTAHLLIRAACSVCFGTLTFDVAPFAMPRTMTIRDAATGYVLRTVRVSGQIHVALKLWFRRDLTLAITAAPGPQSIHATTGSPDMRSVSIMLIHPRLKLSDQPSTENW